MGTPSDVRPTAVVLAAGAGTRFGGKKLEASLGSRPLLAHVLDAPLALALPTLVVVREGDGPLAEVVEGRGLRPVVVPPGPQSASLAAGIEAAGEVSAYLILLADQPLVGKREIEAAVGAWRAGARSVLLDGGKGPQPPAVFDGSLRHALLGLTGDRGAKGLALAQGADLAVVKVPAGPWMDDVDDAAALAALEARAAAKRSRT